MKPDQTREPAVEFWERAGELGYARALYGNEEVASHLTRHWWETAIEISRQLGVKENACVLDLGCGDGDFANLALARHFARVDGVDSSEAAIRRAQRNVPREGVRFETCDITRMDFSNRPRYDAVFSMGILHHVKPATPAIVRGIRTVTEKVIVLEPNGNHLVRKLLECTPSYRAAGDESFLTRQLEAIFREAGFARTTWQRRGLFPNFTPRMVLRSLLPLEHFVETTPMLRALCTVNAWGFVAENPVARPVSRP
jgi:cyclopropane fatty-acyl-phospholipid synthase-like methyltransferase